MQYSIVFFFSFQLKFKSLERRPLTLNTYTTRDSLQIIIKILVQETIYMRHIYTNFCIKEYLAKLKRKRRKKRRRKRRKRRRREGMGRRKGLRNGRK